VERGLAAAHQLAEDGHPSGPNGLLENRKAEPIDLDDEQPRDQLVRVTELAGHEAADEHAVVGVVVADGHQLREQAVEHSQQHGSPHGRRRVTHVNPRKHLPEDHDGPELSGEP
jgi:hypothetical protein